MAYIQPNSTVMLLKGVSLDKSYNHTIYFDSIAEQTFYFREKVKTYGNPAKVYSFTNQTYQRVNRNTIRLAVIADEIYDCNYLMFQNTRFLNKWFYAFIDEVNYINEGATEVVYTIDDMQTWYFDYELGKCFVEREHALTDVIGENLVPESVNLGEYIYHSSDSTEFSGKYMGGLITSKELTGLRALYDPVIGSAGHYAYGDYDAPCGISSGLYVYGGFPIDNASLTTYFENPTQYETSIDDNYPSSPFHALYLLNQVIEKISSGSISGIDEGVIVNTFQCPMEFFSKGYLQLAPAFNVYALTSVGNVVLSRPTDFHSVLGTEAYTPNNKKLLTFPYIKCVCSNQQGSVAELKFEDFDGGEAGIRWFGTMFPTAKLYTVPTSYKRLGRCYDEGVSNCNLPVPAWKGDRYGQWVNEQGNSVWWGIVAAALAATATIASGGTLAPLAAGIGLATTIGSTISKGADLSKTPPATYMQTGNDGLLATAKGINIYLFAQTIKKENAIIIDEYFSMFGYATNRVKIPYVRDNNYNSATLRPCWNYIKTQGCVIHQATGASSGLPSDAEANIARIYDNGITFWNQNVEVGTYVFAANTVEHIGGNNG